ncbi:DUF397 domain-containing protein [Actinomadura sp. 6N118]|uniref:DUF397 domain-containing protein n=1 Tax=Actinomadura sp. 6N118 TaxID=3375151 RepID=UPI0037B3C219
MTRWRKSSYSGGGSDNACVQVARLLGAVGVRDSKDPESGRLELSNGSFGALMAQIKRGEFDRPADW